MIKLILLSLLFGTQVFAKAVDGDIYRTTSSDQSMAFKTKSLTRMYISPSGDISMGNVAPGASLDITGPAKFSNSIAASSGTSALPGITFSGNTNTGIFKPATNVVGITTNGVERFRFDTAGLGIGTTAPGASLDVKGAQRFSGLTSGYVGLQAPVVSGSTTYTLPSTDGSSAQVLSTNGSGVLSWATTSASGWATTGNSGTIFGTNFLGTADAASMAIKTNNTTRIAITASGDIGVGTVAPGASLDVKGPTRWSGSTSGYVGMKAPAVSGSVTYTLPSTDGTNGQVLATAGTGILSWANGGASPLFFAGRVTCGSSGSSVAGAYNPFGVSISNGTAGKCSFTMSGLTNFYGCNCTNIQGSAATDSTCYATAQSSTSISWERSVAGAFTNGDSIISCFGN